MTGGTVLEGEEYATGTYVTPAIVEAQNHYHTVQEETFAPILYLIKYSGDVEDAIAIQNGVRQGLSSSIFSSNLLETETFLSHWGSDCGIANVNIGTSGAEIGGASLTLDQEVRRGDTVLARAKVIVVLVSSSGKPHRIGTLIRSALERFVNQRG